MHKKTRILAAVMSCTMILSAGSSALAAAPTPTVDEALYVNLNAYGAYKESSVVKSYSPNGNATLTDHGTYTDIINKTNYVKPKVKGDTVTFQFDKDKIPNRFYFEGKTKKLPVTLPWNFDISYKLNGAPTASDKLAGANGMVDIAIHAEPNTEATDYFKNNMILTIGAIVDADKVTGVSAPGAQSQAIGNMQAVLFFVLPGETQDYTLSIGSDDFEFSGLFFMMVPGTMEQMQQIQDLRDAKEDIGDAGDAISDSLDVILGTMYGLQGGLTTTASGLAGLDSARATISSGKDVVYSNADNALEELNLLSASLSPLAQDLTEAKEPIAQVNATLGKMTDTLNTLKPQLEDTRKLITQTQTDIQGIRDMINDFDNLKGKRSSLFDDFQTDIDRFQMRMDDLSDCLASLKIADQIPTLSEIDHITFKGMTPNQARQAAKTLDSAVKQGAAKAVAIKAGLADEDGNVSSEIIQTIMTDSQYASAMEAAIPKVLATLDSDKQLLYQMYHNGDLEIQLSTIEETNKVLDQTNDMIVSVKKSLKNISSDLDTLTSNLADVCKQLGSDDNSSKKNTSLTADLSDALDLLDRYCDILEKHSSDATKLLDDFDAAGNIGSEVTTKMDSILDDISEVYANVNALQPTIQNTLSHSSTALTSMSTTLTSTSTFMSSLKNLMKKSGTSLDSGTQKTLNGLINSLNQSLVGLAQTGTLQQSKNTIKNTIDDKWDEYTGEDSNLLNADPDAPAISFTSTENAAPHSIQIVMRTAEISTDDDDKDKDVDEDFHAEGNIFTRILNVFKAIIQAVKGAMQNNG